MRDELGRSVVSVQVMPHKLRVIFFSDPSNLCRCTHWDSRLRCPPICDPFKDRSIITIGSNSPTKMLPLFSNAPFETDRIATAGTSGMRRPCSVPPPQGSRWPLPSARGLGTGDLTPSVDHVIPGQSPLHRKRTPRTSKLGGLFESIQSLLGEDSLVIGMLDESLQKSFPSKISRQTYQPWKVCNVFW